MPPTRKSLSRLPLKPKVFLVLLALAEGEAHGYAINKQVRHRTNGKVKLDPGSLYRLIGRLMEDGLIVESDRRPDVALDDSRRRYYGLTDLGRDVLKLETERMADLVSAARASSVGAPT